MDPSLAVSPFLRRMPFVRNRYVRCNKRSHSVLRDGYMGPKNSESKDYDYENKISPHDYRDFTVCPSFLFFFDTKFFMHVILF